MKNTKTLGIAICAATILAVPFRILDNTIASVLFKKGNFFGGICETLGSVLPFFICAFCFAALIFCRHTRTTRTKNKILSVLLGVATFLASAAAVYTSVYRSSSKNYYAVFGAAAVITAVFICLGATLFKTNYQKTLMTKHSAIGIITSVASIAIYFLCKLVPMRPSYAALQDSFEKFGNYDNPEAFVPFLALSGIGAAMTIWFKCFSEIFPKLKFSRKYLVIASFLITAVILFGSVSSGNTYGSEYIYGAVATYVVFLITSIIVEKREK